MKKIMYGLIYMVISIILLTYMAVDAFSIKPTINKKISKVSVEFVQLKTFLDAKLPQIDSALILHTRQIEYQTEQLEELNELTSMIKE